MMNDRDGDDEERLMEITSSESLFQYDEYVLPLTISATLKNENEKLDFWSSVGLIVGSIIGSGIFISPSLVLKEVDGNHVAAIAVWIFAGILAWLGAACYAELGSMIPESGGDIPYIERGLGEFPAFLFSCSQILILRPASMAILATTSAEYTGKLLSISSAIILKIIACSYLMLISFLNMHSMGATTNFQTIMTLIKLFSLTAIGYAGIFYAFFSCRDAQKFKSEPLSFDHHLSLSVYYALWAYDGWNSLNAVTAEIKNPVKTLPKTLALSVSLVTLNYVTTNLAYFTVLDGDVIMNSKTIAIEFGTKLFGKTVGSILISLIVIISTLGAINATIFTGSRMYIVSTEKSFSPASLGTLHDKTSTPVNAFFFLLGLSIILVVAGNLRTLINIYSILIWLFYSLTVVSLLVLRINEPYLNRPVKVPTAIPVIFCMLAIILFIASIVDSKSDAIFAICALMSMIPIYYIRKSTRIKKKLYQKIDCQQFEMN